MYHQPSTDSWRVAAQSPHRSAVLYAVGEMTQTVRARGGDVRVALWGPKDGAWHLFDAPEGRTAAAPPPRPARSSEEPGKLAERMADRRHQVLMAGLGTAGLYDLTQEDTAALRELVARLDEPTVRRVAHWLAAAGGQGVSV
ncbi:hypothetical protein [Streptomyces sp. Ru72]|uniref:hypothetical protein n=1 Tax=Streptomyces sp. Ru72 TaxID=2080747 RepID=UPI000CDDAA04|nr:hypothetical protein [Streptomyces sp. Ru72]POX54952.1 hypothetical protein C3488_00715 [Streptomyces sp. Ru72]